MSGRKCTSLSLRTQGQRPTCPLGHGNFPRQVHSDASQVSVGGCTRRLVDPGGTISWLLVAARQLLGRPNRQVF
jgi:hypothetical protein